MDGQDALERAGQLLAVAEQVAAECAVAERSDQAGLGLAMAPGAWGVGTFSPTRSATSIESSPERT
ncbi:MAG: hypothetical protein ACLP4R_24125 [Solirubrobacteraceae bacterium]